MIIYFSAISMNLFYWSGYWIFMWFAWFVKEIKSIKSNPTTWNISLEGISCGITGFLPSRLKKMNGWFRTLFWRNRSSVSISGSCRLLPAGTRRNYSQLRQGWSIFGLCVCGPGNTSEVVLIFRLHII